MQYKIEWMENKTTSTGKKKIDATLKGEDGVTMEGVTIWEGFPNYAGLIAGSMVEGDITIKQNGQYTNKTLYAPRSVATTAPRGNFKEKLMNDAMNKKNDSIAHFQNEKELSIKIASTFRAAAEMAIAEYHESRKLSTVGASLEQLFEKWREFCWTHYDASPSDYPPSI